MTFDAKKHRSRPVSLKTNLQKLGGDPLLDIVRATFAAEGQGALNRTARKISNR